MSKRPYDPITPLYRCKTRPTWIAVTTAGVTGFWLGHLDILAAAFKEDGLPFILAFGVIVGVAVKAWRDVRAERQQGDW